MLLIPPSWSVSALKECLRNLIAVGLMFAISAAQRLASPTTSAWGTTALTSPHRSAVAERNAQTKAVVRAVMRIFTVRDG